MRRRTARLRMLIVSPDAFLNSRQEQIVALAAQSRLATIMPPTRFKRIIDDRTA